MYAIIQASERHLAQSETGLPPTWIPPGLLSEKEYPGLPLGWDGYFDLRGHPTPPFNFPAQQSLITLGLSIPLTILFCLENFYTPQHLASLTSLRLHLLGTTLTCELLGARKYEEILHCLPQLKTLDICMIGPENPREWDMLTDDFTLCELCTQLHPPTTSTQKDSRELRIHYMSGLYHEVIAAGADDEICGKVPDLAIAFNSGIHETSGIASSLSRSLSVSLFSVSFLCLSVSSFPHTHSLSLSLSSLAHPHALSPSLNLPLSLFCFLLCLTLSLSLTHSLTHSHI